MSRFHLLNPTLRAVGVISAVAIVVGGVTFASLTSNTATVEASTIDSATASLKIWNGSAFATSAPGFHITGLVPGTGTDEHFYLQNDGDIDMNLFAHVPALPSAPAGGYGFSGFDNLTITVTGDGCADTPVQTNMLALNSGNVQLPCVLHAGDAGDSGTLHHAGNYTVHFDIAKSAVTGSSAGVGSFDLQLTGMQL